MRGDAVIVGLGLPWAPADPSRRHVAGAPWCGADAVGLLVARELAAEGYDAHETSDASTLLTLLENGQRAVLVDAVVGGGPVGAVIDVPLDALAHDVRPISSHGLGVCEVLELARLLYGPRSTERLTVVGVVVDPEADVARPVIDAAAAHVRALLS